MPAQTPAECDIQVIQAINARDMEAALSFYEAEATFVAEPGKPVTGTQAIREVMTGFCAAEPTLTIEVPFVAQSGDTAMLLSKWTMKGLDENGNAVDMEGNGVEIVRRQADGTWKFIIDNPWGTTEIP